MDIAGLVEGASKGEGLGNKFLANIRETVAIIHVLRCFDDENIIHDDGHIDTVRDKETIDLEQQLKDLETVDTRLQKTEKQATTGNDPNTKKEVEALKLIKATFELGKSARTVKLDKNQQKIVGSFQLLTCKPVLCVCNVDGIWFNCGEVIKYDDYLVLVSEQACKDAGKMHTEGKEYV